MNNKVFVGGIPFATAENDLRDHFAQAGNVTSVYIPTDRMTGRSRGFGFVEYGSDEEAQKAVDMFNNTDLGGRNIVVNIARPKADNR